MHLYHAARCTCVCVLVRVCVVRVHHAVRTRENALLKELLRIHDVNERDGHAGADYGVQ